MKVRSMLLGLSLTALPVFAQTPVYLDDSKPIEERVEDALSRMTVEEKVSMTHAQSKFSSPGVARLGIPEFWMTDGLTVYVPKCCGMNGIRLAGPMIPVWLFRL